MTALKDERARADGLDLLEVGRQHDHRAALLRHASHLAMDVRASAHVHAHGEV
jgi:hypothetical protein